MPKRKNTNLKPEKDSDVKVAAILCKWCSYAGADLAGTSRTKYPDNVRIIKVPCSGRVSPHMVTRALYDGADSVLISGCHPGDCHYIEGNMRARRRIGSFRKLIDFMGFEPERVQMSWVSASEGTKWKEVVEKTINETRKLKKRLIFEDFEDD